MGDLNRRPTGQTSFQPLPGDPYSDMLPEQWATQGVNGVPVSRPPVPAETNTAVDPNAAPANLGSSSFVLPASGAPQGDGMDPLTRAMDAVRNGTATANDYMLIDAADQSNAMRAGGASQTTTTNNSGTSQVVENESPELAAARANKDARLTRVESRGSELGRAQEANGLEQASQIEKMSTMVGENALADQKRFEEQRAKLDQITRDATKLGDEYQKAAQGLDPQRLFRGGNRVLASLALAFGAAGATLGHTENFAQKIISDAVNADIDAQKVAIGAKKDALTQNQQLFANYRVMFGDDNAARAKVMADNYKAAALKLESMAAKMTGKEQRARTLDAVDKLRLDANQQDIASREILDRKSVQNSTSTSTTASGGTAAGTAGGGMIDRLLKYQQLKKAQDENNSGEYGESDKVQYRETSNLVGDSVGAMKNIQDLRASIGNGVMDKAGRALNVGEGGRKFNDLERIAKLAITKATTGLTSTEQERKEIADILEAGTWTADGVREKLDRVERFMSRAVNGRVALLSPEQRGMLQKRLQAGKVDPGIIQALSLGTEISQGNTQAAATGFTAGAK